MPMKILTDVAWLEALTAVVDKGRRLGKEVVIHTHFNSPNEISWITEKAMNLLFSRGITVRNQSVLIRGVNDDAQTMQLLVKRLSWINVHPYYVYMHDLVKGVEDLRTTVQTSVDIEKFVRGSTAGFNTPLFICDAPGGGGQTRRAQLRSLRSRERDRRVLGAEREARTTLRLFRSDRHVVAGRASALAEQRQSPRDMIADAVAKAGGTRSYVPA